MKDLSKQWTCPGKYALKKTKMVPPVGKVLVTIFLDSHSIVFNIYMEKENLSQDRIMPLLDQFYSKLITAIPPWWRTKFSSNMTVHQLTHLQLLGPKLSNCTINCPTIFTRFCSFCLLSLYKQKEVGNSHWTRKLSLK